MENSFTYESAKERIIKRPFNISWEAKIHEQETSTGYVSEKGKFNFEGCNDLEKLIIYILGWNLSDTCPFKRTISKYFGWTPYKVAKLVKMSDGIIQVTAVFDEGTGLLAGKGYNVDYQLNKL